jgi:uncharacterized protein (DUF1015 family)
MAEIRPFRAWRYNPTLAAQIDELTSPLFDVVSGKQREHLYQNSLNSIHLSVPKGSARDASALLGQWKRKGILKQDRLPAIYAYYQYYRTPGVSTPMCRKGFVAHVRVHDWEDRVVLRHENTIPVAVNDRIELLRETELHSSPTHGLYTDPALTLEALMDEAIQNPLLDVEDYQGVRDVLAVIQDAGAVQKFIDTLAGKKIILADGHHRYEASITHMNECRKANPSHSGREGYNFHLMYLTNTASSDLRILPTHRLISGLRNFDPEELIKKLSDDFIIKPVDDPDTINEVILGKKWAFGFLHKQGAVKIRLKPELMGSLPWKFPRVVRELDLTVLHYFVIEKILGIPGKEQRTSNQISFDRSFSDCYSKVLSGQAQLALITNEIRIDEVIKVCESGSTLPQKSTYFYPKVVCGFVFSSIREDEFQSPSYSRF